MVVIKGFAQLSLSRHSSQNSSSRASHPTSPSSTDTHLVPRPSCNEDYYLSDDQLVLSDRSARSKVINGLHSPTDLKDLNPTQLKVSWHGKDNGLVPYNTTKPKQMTLNTTSISATVNTQPLAPTSLSTPFTNGHTVQTIPQPFSHKLLLSSLLSAPSHKQHSSTISRTGTPTNPPGTPLATSSDVVPSASVNTSHLQQLEASYVSKVATRLRDLINKVFPSSVENGLGWMARGAPRPSVAAQVGEALKHEVAISSCDSYILRSLLRTAAIPALTVYAGRLDPLLILPSTEPLVLYVPKSTKDVDQSLPVALRYNIEVIRCAWIVRSALDDILGEQHWGQEVSKVLRDGLSPFITMMDAILQHFMGPYLTGVKAHVTARILKCQPSEHANGVTSVKSHLILTRTTTPTGTHGPWIIPPHPHEHLRELAFLLEGIRKLFLVKLACGAESKRWMVAVASQAVWKAMLVFSNWSFPLSANLSQSNPNFPRTTHSVSHSCEPQSSALALKGARNILRPAKRSISPPHLDLAIHNKLVLEVKSFATAINCFVKDIAGLSSEPTNDSLKHCNAPCEFCSLGFLRNPGDQGDLVGEAMNEALEALSAFQLILLALLKSDRLQASLLACIELSTSANGQLSSVLPTSGDDCKNHENSLACVTLTSALQELPPLILLHLIASRITKESGFRLPHEVWGDSWYDYQEELKGFVAAERWLPEVAYEMAKEGRRLRSRYRKEEKSRKTIKLMPGNEETKKTSPNWLPSKDKQLAKAWVHINQHLERGTNQSQFYSKLAEHFNSFSKFRG
ncbi:hypothetical protein O181_004724 [Austropuccinia psidii MF-1]|uniref:Uncharacterized protein n=1 Tax=Austropuccinia psidii MF-1 TaxID=1389203 RepID=A0A9Q3GF63_9BASI|nr:hypothetical protein [Austropuccinia psidii MF-1]